jgi:hypothetical protein
MRSINFMNFLTCHDPYCLPINNNDQYGGLLFVYLYVYVTAFNFFRKKFRPRVFGVCYK